MNNELVELKTFTNSLARSLSFFNPFVRTDKWEFKIILKRCCNILVCFESGVVTYSFANELRNSSVYIFLDGIVLPTKDFSPYEHTADYIKEIKTILTSNKQEIIAQLKIQYEKVAEQYLSTAISKRRLAYV